MPRFKYPTRHFGELGSKLREHVESPDPHALLKKFLHEALHTLSAPVPARCISGKGNLLNWCSRSGDHPPTGDLSVPLEYEGKQYALLILGARENGHPYNKPEREFGAMGHLVAQAIQIANRRDPSLGSGQAPDPSLRSGQAPEI